MSAIRIGLVVVGVLAALIGALWLAQRRLIYLPSGSPGSPPSGWESVTVTTDDGLELTGWHAETHTSAPIVVVFPGNAGNRSGRVPLGNALVDAGLDVLLVEYRGYGGNPGSPSEEGLARDARAFVAWAEGAHPDGTTIYFGESLGAAVAVGVAQDVEPDAIVLRSPFTSLPDTAAVHFPFLPVGLLLWDEYPVLDQVGAIEAPASVVAGTDDGTIPIGQSREVYDAAPTPVAWLEVEGADHNDPELAHGPEVIAAVLATIEASEG
jgi:fermentation-respiration switch protein FrsA (DUF1100 family)